MVIFYSYGELPEGMWYVCFFFLDELTWCDFGLLGTSGFCSSRHAVGGLRRRVSIYIYDIWYIYIYIQYIYIYIIWYRCLYFMWTHTQHTWYTHTMIWFRYHKEISEYRFVYTYIHLHIMTWGVKPCFYDFHVHRDTRQECTSHVNVHPSWYAVNRMGNISYLCVGFPHVAFDCITC